MFDSPIEIFGLIAIAFMVLFYALERLHPIYVFLFAMSCLASAVYAYLISSYPFFIAETIWAAVALQRWFRLPSRST
ncbi:MAG: hypothetical protein AAF541_15745 [Pseudomonadota bacterium]